MATYHTTALAHLHQPTYGISHDDHRRHHVDPSLPPQHKQASPPLLASQSATVPPPRTNPSKPSMRQRPPTPPAPVDLFALAAAAEARLALQSAGCTSHGRVPLPGDPHDVSDEPVTVFHSRTLPPASLGMLIESLMRATKKPPEVMAMGLVLMDRYASARAVAAAKGECASGTTTLHMMHRLYLAALLVAIKSHDDAYYANSTYARFFDLSVKEVNRLELALVEMIDWRTWVRSEHIVLLRDHYLAPPPHQLQQQHLYHQEIEPLLDDETPSFCSTSSASLSSLDGDGRTSV